MRRRALVLVVALVVAGCAAARPAPTPRTCAAAAWRAAAASTGRALLGGAEVVLIDGDATTARIATVTSAWIVARAVPRTSLAAVPADPVATGLTYDFKDDVIASDDPRFDDTLALPADACIHDAPGGTVVGMLLAPLPVHARAPAADGWQRVLLHTAWGDGTYYVPGPLVAAPWVKP